MRGHDIIVVGTSAGGVEALQILVGGFPCDLPAAIFIVLRLAPWVPVFRDVALHYPDYAGVAPPVRRCRRDTGSPACDLSARCGTQPPTGSSSYGGEACASMVLRTITRELVDDS
jgi:CheB methylesterase